MFVSGYVNTRAILYFLKITIVKGIGKRSKRGLQITQFLSQLIFESSRHHFQIYFKFKGSAKFSLVRQLMTADIGDTFLKNT